jgi:3-methyl-2-oxobutanoate hydroxymethyltransferase
MVKIEATAAYVDTIKAVSEAGIPVMAHIGILPQRIAAVGRFHAEATTADRAADLIDLAQQAQAPGPLIENGRQLPRLSRPSPKCP